MFKLISYSTKRLLFAAGVIAAMTEATGYAVTREQYADMINAKSDTEVWNLLRGLGIGQCRVAQGNSTCCACNYYFRTGVVDGSGYDGAPVYNTDNSSATFYAGSPTASRQTPSIQAPTITQHSTGCFPQAGYGLISGGATQWGGNNTVEVTTDAKTYAKNLVVQLIRDAGDPCQISTTIAGLGTSVQVEATVTGNSSNIFFADLGNGKPNPKKCFKRTGMTVIVNGASRPLYNPYGDEKVCKVVFKRIRSNLGSSAVPLISAADKALADTVANGTFAASVTAARDASFQQAVTGTVYTTQTTGTALTTVNLSATRVSLPSLNLAIPSLVQVSQ